MQWWTDLWLNEGFASWIEYLAIEKLHPQWQPWTQLISTEQQQALRLDTLEHTHPIEVPIKHPDEIRTIFDAISYNKGASVIHMLYTYLGPDDFRRGLQHYLSQHAYGNTVTADLWAAFELISGKPVRTFMHAWTSQPGFPLVTATIANDGQTVELLQERFTTSAQTDVSNSLLWPIPLLSNHIDRADTLNQRSATHKLTDAASLKLNSNQSGFYRTRYNTSHLERLGQLVKRGKLSAEDRFGLLSDLFEVAKFGQGDTAEALAFLDNYTAEDNYAVWQAINGAIISLRLVMDDETLRDAMKPYILRITAAQRERLGWEPVEGESHFDSLLRPLVIGLSASADEPAIVARCQELVSQMADNPAVRSSIDPELRSVVYITGARLGDQATFETLLKLHNETHLSEEQIDLCASLTSFRQPELIDRALELITSDAVRLQDVSYWIAYSFVNRHAKQRTWEWMKQHWQWLADNLGTDLAFTRMPIYAARVFSTKDFKAEYVRFFEPQLNPTLDRAYRQGLEMIDYQTIWRERDSATVKQFFSSRDRQ
jgi:puromycin-sensitive aminopeptidase